MRNFVTFKAMEVLGRQPHKKGDVILTSTPFAYVLDYEKRGLYCENCLESNRTKSLFPCKGCGFNFYCSGACVQESWDFVHKYECANLKRCRAKEGEAVPNYVRLLARIILRLKNGGEKHEEKYCNNRGRKFKDLMNHYKDIKNDPVRMQDVHLMMKILTRYIGADNVPNESDFIGIYGRVLVNRFCLSDELNIPMGSAVYLAASIFDHSCIPNAHPSFVGKKLSIRTLVDLPELNLDKVRISYIDCVNSREMRQKDLFDHWYFWCDCDLCNSEERAHFENFIICENPLCSTHIEIPDRYSKVDLPESKKSLPNEDKATVLKKALKASKMEFSFANVPVNPFASTDACMSYIFYDRDRFQLASDSELETDDEASPSNTPPRQKTPDPETPKSNGDEPDLNSSTTPAETEAGSAIKEAPLLNGVDDAILDQDQQPEKKTSKQGSKISTIKNPKPKIEAAGTTGEKDDKLDKPRLTKTKKGSKPETSLANDLNNIDETNSEQEDAQAKITGTKPKTSQKKMKSTSEKEIEAPDDVEETNLTNGHSTHEETLPNGANEEHEENQTTNGDAKESSNGEAPERSLTQLADDYAKKMRKKKRKAPVYEKSDVICPECECFVDKNTLREYRSAVSFTILRLKDMKEDNPNFQVVLDVLERQGTLLPPLNVWKVRTLDFAFNASFYGGAWMLAMKYGLENLEGMKFFYGPGHPSLGLFLMKLAKAHLSLKLYRPGLNYVVEARDILSVAMGPKHPFITGELYDLELMANEDPEICMERRLLRMQERVKEIVCPCCGKKKVIRTIEEVSESSRPWEKDIKYREMMKEDSNMFSSGDYTKY